MKIYSKTTEVFLKGIKLKAKSILIDEMGLDFKKSRLHLEKYSYPLNFVVFEDPQKLGYFASQGYEIGLNKNLMLSAKTSLISDILRHELVHFYQFITSGPTDLPHGKIFKDLCEKFHFSDEVKKPKANLEELNEKQEGDLISERLILKIKKLLSLAESDNIHERELATIKANQLLLKHNLNRYQLNEHLLERDEDIYLKSVLEAKKITSKFHAIYDILELFFVRPVFNRKKGRVFLEVVGTRVNVALADYISTFLDQELEFIWKVTKKKNPHLKGVKARNSFLEGISKGYREKIKTLHRQHASSNELIVLDNNLEECFSRVYGKLGGTTSLPKTSCQASLELGKEAGHSLNIRKGLSSTKQSQHLLPPPPPL